MQRNVTALGGMARAGAIAADDRRSNHFNAPFMQVSNGLAGCPQPEGPQLTPDEVRAERGGSCYRAGRCRLPNSYLYDKEIIPRVSKAILADGRFGDTSVWVTGQRRWVWLKGCVRNRQQADALEQLVRGIDDVEAVVNQLRIGAGK